MIESERIEFDKNKPLNEKIKVLLLALIMGFLVDYFFARDAIGISAIIFNGFLILSFIFTVYPKINLQKKLSLLFLLPVFLLSLCYAIYNNEVLKGINTLLLPFLIAGYCITVRYKNITELKLSLTNNIIERMVPESIFTLPKFFTFTKEVCSRNGRERLNTTQKSIIKGLLMALPLLLIIIATLSSADMVFAYYIENIENFFKNINLPNFTEHAIIIIPIMLYLAFCGVFSMR